MILPNPDDNAIKSVTVYKSTNDYGKMIDILCIFELRIQQKHEERSINWLFSFAQCHHQENEKIKIHKQPYMVNVENMNSVLHKLMGTTLPKVHEKLFRMH